MPVTYSVRTTGATPGATSPVFLAGMAGCAAFAVATILYVLGAQLWSGQRVAEFAVRDGSAVTVGGRTVSRPGPLAHHAGPLALDPAMNPVRVLLHSSYRRTRTGSPPELTVTLRDPDGAAVWTETQHIGSRRSGQTSGESSSTRVLSTFAVPRAGAYAFDVALAGGDADHVRRLRLEVRREVANVRMPFVWIGVGGVLVCLGVAILGGRLARM